MTPKVCASSESSCAFRCCHTLSPGTVNVTIYNPSVLDDTRHPGAELKSREEALNGKVPVLERRASRFRENSDRVEQDDNAMHTRIPRCPLSAQKPRILCQSQRYWLRHDHMPWDGDEGITRHRRQQQRQRHGHHNSRLN